MIASDIVIAGRVRSNQIGKAFFGVSKAMDPEPQEKNSNQSASDQPWEVELGLSAEYAPAKAIDDANHRVHRVEQPPFLRYDDRAEPNRRDIEAELHDERYHVAEITVLDIECGDPYGRAHARHEG